MVGLDGSLWYEHT